MPNPSTIAASEESLGTWVEREGLLGSDEVLPPPRDENAEMLERIKELEGYCDKYDERVEFCKAELKEARELAKEYQKQLRAFIRSAREGMPMFEKRGEQED